MPTLTLSPCEYFTSLKPVKLEKKQNLLSFIIIFYYCYYFRLMLLLFYYYYCLLLLLLFYYYYLLLFSIVIVILLLLSIIVILLLLLSVIILLLLFSINVFYYFLNFQVTDCQNEQGDAGDGRSLWSIRSFRGSGVRGGTGGGRLPAKEGSPGYKESYKWLGSGGTSRA